MAAGQTVIVRVSGFNNDAGIFLLNVSASGPANDGCLSAMPVSEGQYPIDTCYATTDVVANPPQTTVADVWYSYSPSCNGTSRMSTCGGDAFYDSVISVYHNGACGQLGPSTLVANNDDAFLPRSGWFYIYRFIRGYSG